MSMNVGELYALLGLDSTQFEGGMAKAETQFRGFGSTLGGISTMIGLGMATAIAGGLVASVKAAAEFQKQMEMVRTQAGASQAEVDQMSASLLNLAGPLGSSPDELASSLYHVESAGFRGAQALSMVESAAKLAKVGNADFESTTQAVIAAMAAYGDAGLSAADAVAQLNAIVGAGDMRMQKLADAMGTGILASARTFGLSLTDVGAGLATLTDNAIPADEAATNLRHTLSMMGAPSGAAQKAFNAMGLSATELADDMRKPQGLLVALEDLKSHLTKIDVRDIKGGIDGAKADMESFGFTTDQINKVLQTLGPTATEQAVLLSHAFGGGKTSGTILTLLTELDRVKQKYQDIGSGASNFADAWTATTHTLSFRWGAFKDEITADAIKLGNLTLPTLADALGHVTDGLHTGVADVQSFFTTVQNLATETMNLLNRKGGPQGEVMPKHAAKMGGLLSGDEQGVASDAAISASMGAQLANAMISGIKAALGDGKAIADVILKTFNAIDWQQLGADAAPAAYAFLATFAEHWLSPDNMQKAFQKHPVEGLITVASLLTMIFGPEDMIGIRLAELLGRIPLVGPILAALVRNLNKLGGPVRSLAGHLGDMLVLGIEDGFKMREGSLVPMLGSVLERLAGSVTGFGGRMAKGGEDLMISLGQGIGRTLNIPASWIRVGVAQWDRDLSVIVVRFGETAGRAMGAVRDAFIEGKDDVLISVREMVSGVGGDLAGLFSTGWEAGRNLVQGLIDGIMSLIGAVGRAAGSLGSDAVSALKSVLGIQSPSKVFHKLGVFTAQGFMHGIGAGSGGVQSAVAGLVGSPGAIHLGMASGAALGGAVAQKAAQPIYIEINQPVVLDGQVIGRIVDRRAQAAVAGAFA